ncbi:hypothetical protein CEXT_214551 [Caerostris extrusa]|uniref:Uncharacterized protein n=1 Tax=Caerostris extrusa TaxID=172846 RepID=A0AAV4PNM9_CAEEX|nr:hypothetical protein CEXT_214551 [Caerostris extrusa]
MAPLRIPPKAPFGFERRILIVLAWKDIRKEERKKKNKTWGLERTIRNWIHAELSLEQVVLCCMGLVKEDPKYVGISFFR